MTTTHRPVIFIGGGGHAAVCLDVFRSTGRAVIGYVAPESSDDLDLDHLGSDDDIHRLAVEHLSDVFVAIGANRARAALRQRLIAQGLTLTSAVDAHAVCAPSVRIGDCSVVMPGAVINTRSTIGSGVIVNTGSSIDHDCTIADDAHVAPGTHLAGSVHVGPGVFLGVGVSVIPGCSVGEWTVVGAGAAVVRDLPAHSIAVGVPARVSRTLPATVTP